MPAAPEAEKGASIAALRDGGRRPVLVVHGARDPALAAAGRAIGEWPAAGIVRAPQGPDGRRLRPMQVLGSEIDALVYDAWAGFDPDLFGALVGCIRGGGVLLLCCPDPGEWSKLADPERRRVDVYPFRDSLRDDPYLGRLGRLVLESGDVFRFRAGMDALPGLPPPLPMPGCRHIASQQRAVEAVIHVVRGQRRRPAVLQADRGRGKSATLGIAAARLMRAGVSRIAVTAARRESSAGVFRHAAMELGVASEHAGVLAHEGSRLEFVDAARLLSGEAHFDLVLVDEAAGFPLPTLERLLARSPRIAFASTVHGYEGSGRGFALRFRALLERHTRGWSEPVLDKPIRWAGSDPCERFVNRALLLDAAVDCPAPAPSSSVEYSAVGRDQLAADDSLLVPVFGLLVQAHYRTRPFDLRQLLDGPSLELAVARAAGQVVAVVLWSREGGLPEPLGREVTAGRRRPRGHLLPGALASHVGLPRAAAMSACRIVRIAVAGPWQRRGVGSGLLGLVATRARSAGIDYLGTSFSLGPGLIRFWSRGGFRPAWLGHRANAVAAARPLLMVRGLGEPGTALCREAESRFRDGLAVRLSGAHADIDADTVVELFAGADLRPLGEDVCTARRFGAGSLTYEAASTALWRVAPTLIAAAAGDFPDRRLRAVVEVVLKQRDPGCCAPELGYPGRRELISDLLVAFQYPLGP